MPSIKSKLNQQLINVNKELEKLGSHIVVDDNNKFYV